VDESFRRTSYEGEAYPHPAARALILEGTGDEGLAPHEVNQWVDGWLSRTGFIGCNESGPLRITIEYLCDREPTATPDAEDSR
jgi:hypothetical protein